MDHCVERRETKEITGGFHTIHDLQKVAKEDKKEWLNSRDHPC